MYALQNPPDGEQEARYKEDAINHIFECARTATEEVQFRKSDFASPLSYDPVSKELSDYSLQACCLYLTSLKNAVHNLINDGEAKNSEYLMGLLKDVDYPKANIQ